MSEEKRRVAKEKDRDRDREGGRGTMAMVVVVVRGGRAHGLHGRELCLARDVKLLAIS